jgi:hypothetical protein
MWGVRHENVYRSDCIGCFSALAQNQGENNQGSNNNN